MKDRHALTLLAVLVLSVPVIKLAWGYPPQFFGPGGGDTIQPTYINERGQEITREEGECLWFPFIFSGMPSILMVAPPHPRPEEIFAPIIGLALWTAITSRWKNRWWIGLGFSLANILAGFGVGLMVWGIMAFAWVDAGEEK